MRFGGHETFALREGWLHRGLRLLVNEKDQLVHPYAADWLGVGRNMAKSIRYWLVATRLATPSLLTSAKSGAEIAPTELGRLIWEKDPYFLQPGTLWALHINLVHNVEHAYGWGWFFNSFAAPRFDRALAVDRLNRHLRLTQSRLPSPKTLQREIACLLQTYSRPVPAAPTDPEEAQDCPFTELGLISHFTDSGTYRLRDGSRFDIPVELFGYALAQMGAAAGGSHMEIKLHQAAVDAGSPGRVFALTEEAVFDLGHRYEADDPRTFTVRALGADRVLRMPARSAQAWLSQYFERVWAGKTNAA